MKNPQSLPRNRRPNRPMLVFPEVIKLRHSRRQPAPKQPKIDEFSDLRRELYAILSETSDKGSRSAFLLLIAVLDRNESLLPKRGDRASILAGLQKLKDSIGYADDQVYDANGLWHALPQSLAPRNEVTVTDLMSRFVRLTRLGRKQREALEREVRVVTRAIQFNTGEARRTAYDRVWAALQTKI